MLLCTDANKTNSSKPINAGFMHASSSLRRLLKEVSFHLVLVFGLSRIDSGHTEGYVPTCSSCLLQFGLSIHANAVGGRICSDHAHANPKPAPPSSAGPGQRPTAAAARLAPSSQPSTATHSRASEEPLLPPVELHGASSAAAAALQSQAARKRLQAVMVPLPPSLLPL